MTESDQCILTEFKKLAADLEIIYSFDQEGGIPPGEYGSLLTWALFKNDASYLMKVLGTQDINPWDVNFVEDGWGDQSLDMQDMIVFAARKKSWACVAELVKHYQDCGQSMKVVAAVQPSLAEYEAAAAPERIAFIESFFHAVNAGYAKNLAACDDMSLINQPCYLSSFPKATRFILKDFATIQFSNKKLGPILNKRLTLRQKTIAAIASGDKAQLEKALDVLNINAMANQTATRKQFDAISLKEIQAFVSESMACEDAGCVQVIFSKCMEYAKARAQAKPAIKKSDEGRFTKLTQLDNENMLNAMLAVAKAIDMHGNWTKVDVASSVEGFIENSFFSVLVKSGDRWFISQLKGKSEEFFSVLRPCLEMACARAESMLEKQGMEAAIPINDQPVALPRERAGVRL